MSALPKSRFTGAEIAAMLPKRGKVRNVAPREDRTYNGVVYHSKAEAVYAFGLDAQKSAGKIYGWTRQVPFPITVSGKLICRLRIDFGILDGDGYEYRYVEVKGWESEVWKLKKRLLLACYPDIKLDVVKA